MNMKVYRYDKKTLDLGRHPLESDFLFETAQDVNIYDIFEYEDKNYSICTISVDGWAEAKEVDWTFENDDTYAENTIVCPICGEKIETCDLSDWSNGDIDCPNCGAELEYEIDYTFSTTVKNKPVIRKIK